MYYECHITLGLHPKTAKYAIEMLNWKFSCIDGDPSLGDGPREYATRHVNSNADLALVIGQMGKTAEFLQFMGFNVLRQKVELVLFDTKKAGPVL